MELFRGGVGYHGGIGEEEKPLQSGYLRYGDVCEHMSFLKQSALLVEHGTQQVVGVHGAFHEHLGTPLRHLCHSFARSIVHIGGEDYRRPVGILGVKTLCHGSILLHGNEYELSKFFADTALYHLFGVGIGRTCHSHCHALRH